MSAAKRNFFSRDSRYLKSKGWTIDWEKPMGFSFLICWRHPKHGKMMQGHALRFEKARNKERKQGKEIAQ